VPATVTGVPATLYRDCAVVDDVTRALQCGMSILVEGGRVRWIRPVDGEEDPGPDAEVVDAGGTTAVPGMVDAHSHLTMPGGSHWTARGTPMAVEVDDGDGLLAAAARQLDDGADLAKLYLDGPDRETSPFTARRKDLFMAIFSRKLATSAGRVRYVHSKGVMMVKPFLSPRRLRVVRAGHSIVRGLNAL
jgi:predicted amidohydrolase YtcJ